MTKAEHIFDRLLIIHGSLDVPDFSEKTVRYTLDSAGLAQRLELLFRRATSRFFMLSYGAAWEHTLPNSSEIPTPPNSDSVSFRFHDFDNMTHEIAAKNNSDFSAWLSGQLLRDLSEYLAFHLLEVYEVCLLVSLHKKELSEGDISEAKHRVLSFEANSLKDRFKRLQKEFGIKTPFKEAILSLNAARNIFAHSNGKVEKRHCDKKGKLRIHWPTNRSFLIQKDNGKKISYNRVRKPFSSEKYSQAGVDWLSNTQTVTYSEGDQISVESKDFQDIIFFYFYATKELQTQITDFFTNNGVPVMPVESYCGSFTWQFVGEEDTHEAPACFEP